MHYSRVLWVGVNWLPRRVCKMHSNGVSAKNQFGFWSCMNIGSLGLLKNKSDDPIQMYELLKFCFSVQEMLGIAQLFWDFASTNGDI